MNVLRMNAEVLRICLVILIIVHICYESCKMSRISNNIKQRHNILTRASLQWRDDLGDKNKSISFQRVTPTGGSLRGSRVRHDNQTSVHVSSYDSKHLFKWSAVYLIHITMKQLSTNWLMERWSLLCICSTLWCNERERERSGLIGGRCWQTSMVVWWYWYGKYVTQITIPAFSSPYPLMSQK